VFVSKCVILQTTLWSVIFLTFWFNFFTTTMTNYGIFGIAAPTNSTNIKLKPHRNRNAQKLHYLLH